MIGNGSLIAKYAHDNRELQAKLRAAEVSRDLAEANEERLVKERDRCAAECMRLREENDIAARALADLNDLYQSARRLVQRREEEATVRPPTAVIFTEDDGEMG